METQTIQEYIEYGSPIQYGVAGVPHFRGIVKQKRNSSTDFPQAMGDLIDNPLNLCKNIIVTFLTRDQKIYEINISDNCSTGMENILKNGSENPLNLAHVNSNQDDDKYTSTYGHGAKNSIIWLSSVCEIYTKIPEGYYLIKMDINKMVRESIPEKSYNTELPMKISRELYENNHINGFKNGTSIKLKDLQECAKLSFNNLSDLADKMYKDLNEIYNMNQNTKIKLKFENEMGECEIRDIEIKEKPME